MLRNLLWFVILATPPAFATAASPFVDVMTCAGVKGDGTDDGAAINACLAANPSKTIFFPKRSATGSTTPDYFSTQTLLPKGNGQKLMGEGEIGFCAGRTCTSTIQFAAGVTGVEFRNDDCQGCAVEHLTLWGREQFHSHTASECVIPDPTGTEDHYGPVFGTSSADGIRVRAAHTTIRDSFVVGFGRHGIRGDGNTALGFFADEMRIDNVLVFNNRGDGFNESGSDRNGSSFDLLRAYANQFNGIKEQSNGANTWIAPVADNNHDDLSTDGPPHSIASIVGDAVTVTVDTATSHGLVQGNGVSIANTAHHNGNYIVSSVPTTTRFQIKSGITSAESSGAAKLTKCGTTWATAGQDADTVGGFNFRTAGGLNTIVGAIAENGAKSIFGPGNLIIGGSLAIDTSDKANLGSVITRDGAGLRFNQFTVNPNLADGSDGPIRTYFGHMYGDYNAPDPLVIGVADGTGGSAFGMEFRKATDINNKDSPWFGWRTAFSSDMVGLSNYSMLCAYGQTLEANGANPPCWFPNGFYIGSQGMGIVGQARQAFFSRNAKPTTGEWLIGDKAWNTNEKTGLASGGFAGWVNIAPGPAGPGTWRAFAPLGTCDTGVWECPGTIGSTTQSSGAFTTVSATKQITSTQATGSAPIAVSSETPVATMVVANHPRVQGCGDTTSCSHTATTGAQIVFGSVRLLPGNSWTATISGISPPFTSASSYVCTVAATGSSVVHVVRVKYESGSSFTIALPERVSDVVSYICVGN